jgi:hypothetical protein
MRLAADMILVLHAAFIAFVLFGLVLIWVGYARKWHWTQTWTLRLIHLAAIGFVILQAYLGIVCPLTTLENSLRLRAGQDAYTEAGFIEYWLHRAVFWHAPAWVFTVAYTAFGLLVIGTLILLPPRRRLLVPSPLQGEG